MNDEIKEINIKIPGQILDYVDTKEHLLDLFNYITNLQQLEQEHKKINGELRERIAYLERSNDRREDTILGLRQGINDVEDKNSKLEIALQNIQEDYDRRVKEIDVLKKKLDRRYYKNEYERLKEENERLNNLFEYNMQTLVNTDKLYEDYKSRCEKASEYVKNNPFMSDLTKISVLNILQNERNKGEK